LIETFGADSRPHMQQFIPPSSGLLHCFNIFDVLSGTMVVF
jgi:hypothetical protein